MDQALLERAADAAIAENLPQLVQDEGELLLVVTDHWVAERGRTEDLPEGSLTMVSSLGTKIYVFRAPKGGSFGVGKTLGLGKNRDWQEGVSMYLRVDGEIMYRPASY